MSVESGGTEAPSTPASGNLPENSQEAINQAKRQLVSRKRDVKVVFSQPVDADSVVDAIISLVGTSQQIECIQAISSRKFLVSFSSVELAEYFCRVKASALCISGWTPSCRWLGSERKRIRVAFLPYAVPNTELTKVLQKYGQVIQVIEETYANKPFAVKTGTRVVDMDMTTPVPNILTVCGFTVPVTYKGVVIQCRRCLQGGHIKADCKSPFCDKCRTFGHSDKSCTAPCLKCKSPEHHWRECTVRSYAFAAAGDLTKKGPLPATNADERLDTTLEHTTVSGLPDDTDNRASTAQPSDNATSDTNRCPSANTTNTEDGFGSATENDFEPEGESLGLANDGTHETAAQNVHASVTCDLSGAAGKDVETAWQNAKRRNKKRKNVSLTSEKSPETKKTARETEIELTDEAQRN